MFSEADAYERFMGRWSRQLAPLMVKFAGVEGGEAVLDVGSGTGALASAVAGAVPVRRVVGIDLADTYLAFARARNRDDRIQFETGDAQQLRFGDATFDRTLSLLNLNFIPDHRKALREMIRVTKTGGIVGAAVWDYGGAMEMLRVFWDQTVALFPRLEGKDERHMPLCRRGELEALWRDSGLEEIAADGLSIETRFTSFEDYWVPFLEKQGPAGTLVASLSKPQRDRLRQRLQNRLVRNSLNEPVVLTARAWAVRGKVRRDARTDLSDASVRT